MQFQIKKTSKELWARLRELNPKSKNMFPPKLTFETTAVYEPQDVVYILNPGTERIKSAKSKQKPD